MGEGIRGEYAWNVGELEEETAGGCSWSPPSPLSLRRGSLWSPVPPPHLSRGMMGAGTCSSRHLSTAHSTSQAALSLAYCCCSRSRAHWSSRSSERRSSSKVFSALHSCWFSTTCGDTGVGRHLMQGFFRPEERRLAIRGCWAVSKVPLEMGAEPCWPPGPWGRDSSGLVGTRGRAGLRLELGT